MQEKLEIQEIYENFFLYIQLEILAENLDPEPICRPAELVSSIPHTSHKEVASYYPVLENVAVRNIKRYFKKTPPFKKNIIVNFKS